MDRWINTEKMKIFQKELCKDCPDAPMDDCPYGCMRKVIYNALLKLKEYEDTGLELEEVEILKQCQSSASGKAKAIKKLQAENRDLKKAIRFLEYAAQRDSDILQSELDRAKAELEEAKRKE